MLIWWRGWIAITTLLAGVVVIALLFVEAPWPIVGAVAVGFVFGGVEVARSTVRIRSLQDESE